MNSRNKIIIGIVGLVILIVGGYWYWQRSDTATLGNQNIVTPVTPQKVALYHGIGSRSPGEGCEWKKYSIDNPKFSLLAKYCEPTADKFLGEYQNDYTINANGFQYADGVGEHRVVELFAKEKDETPPQVLQRLFVARLSDPYERAHCVPTQQKDVIFNDQTKVAWELQPDATYMAKHAKEAGSGIPSDICLVNNNYGYYFNGQAYFEFHANSPEHFVWVELGQDIESLPFDEQSIEF